MPNLFGNINFSQNGTLSAFLFQWYKIQAINLLFNNLAIWYSFINKLLFKTIFENTLALMNIFKLSMDSNQHCQKIKVLKISNILTINSVIKIVLLSDIKGPSLFF